jgi:hypothetical protein
MTQSLNAATARLRNDHFDLVVVAIDRLSAVEMSLLERDQTRVIRADRDGAKPDPDLILRSMRSGVRSFSLRRLTRRTSQERDRLVRRTAETAAWRWPPCTREGGLGDERRDHLAYGSRKITPTT